MLLEGDTVKSGAHTIELRRSGGGPLYFNAYLTNFTKEAQITSAGLEVKVQRNYFKLVRDDKKVSDMHIFRKRQNASPELQSFF